MRGLGLGFWTLLCWAYGWSPCVPLAPWTVLHAASSGFQCFFGFTLCRSFLDGFNQLCIPSLFTPLLLPRWMIGVMLPPSLIFVYEDVVVGSICYNGCIVHLLVTLGYLCWIFPQDLKPPWSLGISSSISQFAGFKGSWFYLLDTYELSGWVGPCLIMVWGRAFC